MTRRITLTLLIVLVLMAAAVAGQLVATADSVPELRPTATPPSAYTTPVVDAYPQPYPQPGSPVVKLPIVAAYPEVYP